MPYRRLPNTDAARIRAMKIAIERGTEIPPHKLAFSARIAVQVRNLLSRYELNMHLYRQAVASRNKSGREYAEIVKKARTYLTHFLRVMNMAIVRGDLPPETRVYFELDINDPVVPAMNTDNELLSWGRRIIAGEAHRIRKGGNPVTNPSIAQVIVRYEKFAETHADHIEQEKRIIEYMDKNTLLRKEADELILQIWNEVEEKHASLPEEARMKENEIYGVVYFYRRNEAGRSGV